MRSPSAAGGAAHPTLTPCRTDFGTAPRELLGMIGAKDEFVVRFDLLMEAET